MDCAKCRELRQTFEFKLGKYIEARSAAYYRVSTELAAHRNVDMERAKNDLEEHQFVCVAVVAKVRERLDQPVYGTKEYCCRSDVSVIDQIGQTWPV
jgi:hypothetical protein